MSDDDDFKGFPFGRQDDEPAPRRKRGPTSTFNCWTGRWKGRDFAVPADLMHSVTEYGATNDIVCVFHHDRWADGSFRGLRLTMKPSRQAA